MVFLTKFNNGNEVTSIYPVCMYPMCNMYSLYSCVYCWYYYITVIIYICIIVTFIIL